MSAKRASVVICVPEGPARTAVTASLERAGFFDVLGTTDNPDDLAGLLSVHYPDLVIVDGDLCPDGAESFAQAAAGGRPVPTLELVDEERPSREPGKKRLKHSRLGKDILLGTDLVSQNHVWARLLAVADQLTQSRHTQTATRLGELMRGVRVRARHSGHRPEVVNLATRPLDLIVLIGDGAAVRTMADLLASVPTSRVPILAQVPGGLDPTLLTDARLPVSVVETTVALRRAEGILLSSGRGAPRATGEDLVVDARATASSLELLQSLGTLGGATLAVLLSESDAGVAKGLASVLNAGGLVAALDPGESSSPQGPQAAIAWGLTEMVLKLDELAWVLKSAVPRRR